eukprot:1478201-Alexandrium_andersonii.AAC.1
MCIRDRRSAAPLASTRLRGTPAARHQCILARRGAPLPRTTPGSATATRPRPASCMAAPAPPSTSSRSTPATSPGQPHAASRS